jgi:alpha-ketoglutarate-dependent taurine dioxygenase
VGERDPANRIGLTSRQGDILTLDNRCLLHRADPNFDAARQPRVLHRTCLRGTTPA